MVIAVADKKANPVDALKSITHKVQKGETLAAIARENKTTIEKLVELNGIKDPARLSINQIIKVPSTGTTREDAQREAMPKPKVEQTQTQQHGPEFLKKFEAGVKGIPYRTPAPFCRSKPEADQPKYDCVTLVLKYLGEKGVSFKSGRTDRGDKVMTDHLIPYAHASINKTGNQLVCKDKKTGDAISKSEIKEGDVALIGHKFSKAEGGFSVSHLGIVKYERDKNGQILKGKDGEPLIYILHANSTGRYGQQPEVVTTGLRTYLAQRAGDEKRTAENKARYSEVLICKIKPESQKLN